MRTLLVDNYDSFTWNLFQLLAEVNGSEPVVVRNDEASWRELAGEGFEAVVISAGPGRPDREADFGLCAEAIADGSLPLLGVCLGHQGIGIAGGGAVEPAPEPFHGRLSRVHHDGTQLFAGIPPGFEAVRYHSLALVRPLPHQLEEIAWTASPANASAAGGEANAPGRGVPMAVAHRTRPQWGVQFHPESVATEHGERLLRNFHDLAEAVSAPPSRPRSDRMPFVAHRATNDMGTDTEVSRLGLRWRRLEQREVDAEAAFVALYGGSREAFWLDSALPGGDARFSFMGDASGPHAQVLIHEVGAGGESLFGRLDRELRRLPPLDAALPFDFQCGLAGYLGYELKAECGGERAHESPHPDATLIFADRTLAFDHQEGHVYLLCLHEAGEEGQADEWLSAAEASLLGLPEPSPSGEMEEGSGEPPRRCSTESSSISPHWDRPEHQYLADIAECQRLLHEGESYEICLTSSMTLETDADPLALYRRLRRINPAPHAAFLRLGELAVLSSSPERFLRVDREGAAEARPIKGTIRRGATVEEDAELAAALAADEKSRAENLMIADLMRNDLGSVCEIGSVEVPALMAVESYATVHQLVTTVRGRLRPDLTAVDATRACFPAGSMTGAPKRRTMAILDRLEGRARGVYSGAIGFFGPGGACDLGVAIRTAVLRDDLATIGSGGAIVAQSDPVAEHEELLLKATTTLRAIDPGATAPISLAPPRKAAFPAPPAPAQPT
ncbi:MAG TPA: aminodeoxychorismate synthase component I [Solirubrobacterales bacterium]|nr:aminodeoxychorismate synthase component I [Solirubrobacterales bacterium]